MGYSDRTREYDGWLKLDTVITNEGRHREIVVTRDTVAVLIYVPQRKEVVLVQQARLSMIDEKNPDGDFTEVVAGVFDLEIGVKDLMVKEILEETGIRVTSDQIELANNGERLATSPGCLTERMYLGYVEVDIAEIEEDRIFGLAQEGEIIKRLFVPVEELRVMSFQDMKTWALVQWFLQKT